MGTAPGVYLREDPICGTQLENQSELRAPSADKAALYLDAALAARSATGKTEQDVILVFVTPLFWGFAISVCRLREKRRMSKTVYVRVFHHLELLRYVLRCAIEQQL